MNMKHKLNNYTILNGKYAIEQYIDYQDNCYKYKATDLVMREEVYIYEFCPEYIAGRIENTDRLNIKESVFVQFSEELKAFESNLSSVALGKRNAEIAKNYFRENNTGYLVVAENKKSLIKRKFITRVVLGGLVAIVAIEAGVLLFSRAKKDDKSANDATVTEESIEQLIEEDTVVADDTDIFVEDIDEDIEAKEERKQYSEEELLSMIEEKSGEVLWGSYDTEENANIIQKIRFGDNALNEYLLWSPSEGYEAMLYEDFDGDGYNEMFALMCEFNESMFWPTLWFTDGSIVQNLTYPELDMNREYDAGEAERTCAGLLAIQFGKKRIAQIVFVDAWYRADINSAYQYVYENGEVIQAGSDDEPLVLLNDEEFNVLALNMNTDNIYFMKNSDEIDRDLFSNFSSKHINLSGLENMPDGGLCYDDYIVYYKDGSFYEYGTKKINIDEAGQMCENFADEKAKLEETLKKLYYSYEEGYMGEYHSYFDSELKSIYFAENDKLYLNYQIKGLFEEAPGATMEYGGHEYVNGVTTFDVSFCYSVNDDQMKLYSTYVGERGESSDLFD